MKYCWEHLDEYLAYRENAGLDIKTAKGYIRDLSSFLKENYPEDTLITRNMIDKWCVQRSTEKSYSYKSRISYARQFTLFAYPMGYSDFVLITDFLPKAERYVPYIFSDNELIELFDYAIKQSDDDPDSFKKLQISVIYRLIYFCGLRPNEGRELKINDVDIINGTLFIRKNKTHKERLIPIANDVCEMIKEYIIKRSRFTQSEYLFPSPRGGSYGHKWLRTQFLELWNQSKSPGNTARVRVYDLRHRWATAVMHKFLNEGSDLLNVLPYMSAYMGHSSFEETAYYIHLLPENLLTSKSIDWNKMNDSIPKVSHDE